MTKCFGLIAAFVEFNFLHCFGSGAGKTKLETDE